MGLFDFTYYSIVCRNAGLYKEKTGWYEAGTGKTVSFQEVKEMTDSLAAGLRAKGIAKGDRIGVVGKNSLEFFLLYGAAAALGAVMLPINWRLSAGEIQFNLHDGRAKILFADQEFGHIVDAIKADLPTVKHIVCLSGKIDAAGVFSDLLGQSEGFQPEDVPMDCGFVIIHTAAVAGRPRGALLSHANIVFSSLEFIQAMSLQKTDVHLNILPLFHVGGLFMTVSCFHAGATCLNMDKFDAGTAARLVAEKKATVMFDFAPILGSLLEQGQKNGVDLSSLQKVIGLDSPETIVKYQDMTGGTFYSFFGQTETSCLATIGPYNDRPGSAGRPVQAAEVALVDDKDRQVREGDTGEIVIKGPMVFKEYINLPEDTAHTFRNTWHHTGDLGRFDQDGFLFYMGRKAEKELIKPGGENVYPAEVENAILLHPAIARTVVFGVPDPKWKEGIKAVCQLKAGHDLTAQELIDFVGNKIARYKKPQYVQFVTDLPLLADGSPDRAQIKGLYTEKS
jgi:acyl-CoA synthetase (AMP-forming)/AMP-acid ligase II